MEDKEFLTLEEAAEYVGMKRASIYNYIHDLNITTRKFKRDRRHYIAIADVKRMKEHKKSPWKSETEPSVAQPGARCVKFLRLPNIAHPNLILSIAQMADTKVGVFPGFYNPELYDGWTKLPHELFDEMYKMKETELKVILYIFRHTWGFQEFDHHKKMTTDEFMYGRKKGDGIRMDNGTGLSDWGVRDGLNKAEEHGYITCEINSKDKARIKKYYSINIRKEE